MIRHSRETSKRPSLGVGNQVQKTIQTEDDEDQAEENARDGDDVLHRLAPFVCICEQHEAEFPSCVRLVVSTGRCRARRLP